MPVDTVCEGPRPPGRRSIHLYGLPPVRTYPAGATDATALKSTGIGVLDSTGSMTQPSINSTSPRRPVAAVLSLDAAAADAGGAEARAGRPHNGAEPVVTTSPRHLRGRLNEGTVHRAPHVVSTAASYAIPRSMAATRAQSREASKGRGPTFGPSVVSWVHVASGEAAQLKRNTASRDDSRNSSRNGASQPASRTSRAPNTAAAAEITQMVNDASMRNTWAMRFANTAVLRQAVSTNTDTYTHFEEALLAELNTLRRAPAEYAAVVEHEAKVGVPYVREDDIYFSSEAAAEDAGLNLRRRMELEGSQEASSTAATAATAAAGAGGTPAPTARFTRTSSNASSVSSRNGPSTNGPATATAAASAGSVAAATSPTGNERKKMKKRYSNNVAAGAAAGAVGARVTVLAKDGKSAAADPKDAASKLKEGEKPHTTEQQQQSEQETPGKVTLRSPSPTRAGPTELTLAELRHQFRCQQRYRAALETSLKELKAEQRQVEAAQLATWAAEDEKAQKRARRSTGNTPAMGTAAGGGGGVGGSSAASFPVAGAAGAGGVHKNISSIAAARRGSPAVDETLALRRGEEAALTHRIYEERVNRLDVELQRARSACQRSLAGGNLISSAVRVLREARPAPPLKCSRGLSLAARDTAEVYYGDAERVSALSELYALSRATLIGLCEVTGSSSPKADSSGVAAHTSAAATAPHTLEELSLQGGRGTPDDVDAATVPPSGVFPILSEEALLLAQVAQRACTTYGYISDEVRGAHLQGIGSPRTLLLQFIVGCFTPVVDIVHQPGASTSPQSHGHNKDFDSSGVAAGTADADGAAMRCYAGVRLHGSVYAARPDVLSPNASGEDVYTAVFGAKSDHTSVLAGSKKVDHTAVTANASHTSEAAEDAMQRLWPLLWSGASTVGCGWQQVRGWRHVPTYAEARQMMEAEQHDSSLMQKHETAVTVTTPAAGVFDGASRNANHYVEHEGQTAVICSTLLLASGFEEYEVGRACSGMTPAATRRVFLEPTNDADEGVMSSGGRANDARRAAVEVHSALGVTLLTPTMHPVIVPPSPAPSRPRRTDGSGAVVCVAVRVPYADEGGNEESAVTARSLALMSGTSVSAAIRVVALITRQSDPTPSCPSVNPAEVLLERSPADPSVWLVLVNTAAAFAHHGDVDGAQPVPLALHLFAKDMRDATGAYEHVAFIRLQQGHEGSASPAAARDTCPSVLIAPEWRYLLKGLSCLPCTMTPPPTTATPAALQSTTSISAASSGAATPAGWAVLHEPLLSRDGVLLHPLSSNLRASCRSDDVSAVRPSDARDGNPLTDRTCSLVSATENRDTRTIGTGEAVHVAIQLPAHANALWWGRRVAALRATRQQLEAEVAVEAAGSETEDAAAGSMSTTNPGNGEGNNAAVDGPADAATGVAARNEQPAAIESVAPSDAAEKADSTANAASAPSPTSPLSLSTTAAGTSAAAAAAATAVHSKKASNGCSTGKRGASNKNAAGGYEEGASPERKGARGNSKAPTRVSAAAAGGGTPSAPLLNPPTKGGAPSSSAGLMPSLGNRHTLNLFLTVETPESPALCEYEALLKSPPPALPPPTTSSSTTPLSTAKAIGVPAYLQAACISLPALRVLSERLRADAQIWQAHRSRVQPFLDNERVRIAGEATRKRGKEQQRLQHDQDDVTSELASMQRRAEVFQQAVQGTSEALRKRERAQVLRRARLSRVTAELAHLEEFLGTAEDNAGEKGAMLTPPRVALRLFNKAAVAAGSGRNAAAAAAVAAQAATQDPPAVHDVTVGAEGRSSGAEFVSSSFFGAAAVTTASENEVVLQPQPVLPLSVSAKSSSCDNLPAVVYAASCTVPPSFSGQATLMIDDEVAVTWSL
ncbi:hypothetical protein ABB37_02284 [Leptomonas pyrrhocoris]|uniref:Uncharacterized protein n=1 Tax=Leptomonas pyrrhocoris TaxID=157538 RepID=A0A0M9G7H1_LEPPY|nr:hypothetical protein ABB37_02284 [Leptomonas pyrrhocoris]KPA84240.1 hypothetical protein ABB37_02284 [Leptomonas pyrrhocoris]|eukprot:XP_015662679.1 hypothetical protein ABB37_02284 [Leptomonas pyrrhocoris]